MKKIFIAAVFIVGILCISCNDVEEGGKEGWDYDTIVIDSSCSMYIEYHYGKEFYKIATIDFCPKLTPQKYINTYKNLLEKFSNRLVTKKGIATFETPFEIRSDTNFTKSLIETTSKFFNANIKIVKEEKSIFIVDVIPKN